MDYKKSTAPTNTVTRDVMDLCKDTENIYESVAIIGKRANQISADIKAELNKKLQEFASPTDTLDETFENREQIEISRFYERLPVPGILPGRHLTGNDDTKNSDHISLSGRSCMRVVYEHGHRSLRGC